MALISNFFLVALLVLSSSSMLYACDPNTLNTTTGEYPITVEGTTIFDVAAATGRGVCDIARFNMMADVAIPPNIGQVIAIPPQTCTPDNTTCILPRLNPTRNCIFGGPRLYYTVKGDTYERIALYRLNITLESLMPAAAPGEASTDATAPLPVGQFVKVPQCSPSQCVIQPVTFEYGVYKDLAEKYGSTVGQIMMLSPTYNYSEALVLNRTRPSIDVAINCTALSNNLTVLA
ncbi:hypothetical protein BU26DRAFT_520047 [Trematosphaeria pertusa]|uniref:LysM domain-containing protein n=1 Tax=Trematosphaeria pertusa TaxID=390896 RepID=A0A6A6IFP8_9PLEO|nr:uncharacterized protein BU26DRAFT_520047 [Trematosphaeria pertusa]KAF2248350.1 hypothetical protein BU26DRAFT_520047 [Trematosphaeria pertusa]